MQQGQEALGGLFTAIGIVLGIDLALLLYAAFRRYVQNRPAFSARWSLADLWFGAQYAIVVLILLSLLLLTVISLAFPGVKLDMDSFSDAKTLLFFVLPGTILQNIVFFAVPASFIVFKYEIPLRDIGLPPLPTARDWKIGLGIGLVALLGGQLVGWAVERLAEAYREIPLVNAALEFERGNPVSEIVNALPQLGTAGLVMAVVGIGIGAALGEEMLFRGFVFNALKVRFGLVPALIVSALLFTLPHTYALGLVPIFFLGLLLAWLYHRMGSLWIPIIIHATNNTISVIIAFFAPVFAGGQ